MMQLFNGAVRTGNRVHSVMLYIKNGPADVQAAQFYPDVHLSPGPPCWMRLLVLVFRCLRAPVHRIKYRTLYSLPVSYC